MLNFYVIYLCHYCIELSLTFEYAGLWAWDTICDFSTQKGLIRQPIIIFPQFLWKKLYIIMF